MLIKEIIDVCAILAITGIGLYPILSKKEEVKTTKWLLKRFSFVAGIYTISAVIVLMLGV